MDYIGWWYHISRVALDIMHDVLLVGLKLLWPNGLLRKMIKLWVGLYSLLNDALQLVLWLVDVLNRNLIGLTSNFIRL